MRYEPPHNRKTGRTVTKGSEVAESAQPNNEANIRALIEKYAVPSDEEAHDPCPNCGLEMSRTETRLQCRPCDAAAYHARKPQGPPLERDKVRRVWNRQSRGGLVPGAIPHPGDLDQWTIDDPGEWK